MSQKEVFVKEMSKEVLSMVKDAVGKVFDVVQLAQPAIDHGRTELAAAIFRESDAYVMYQHKGNEQELAGKQQDAKQPEMPQQQQEHGGREM